jgi:hypothetical protein
VAEKRGTAPAIIAAAEQAAKVADRLGSLFATELQRVLRRTAMAMPDLLTTLTAAAPEQAAAIVGASRPQIRAILRQAGFDALAEGAYGATLDPVIRRVLALRRAAGLDAALTAEQKLQIEAFGALYRNDLLAEGDVAARALWRASVRGVFGGSEVRTILDELEQVLTRTEPQVRTLYDTSVSILSRQVEAIQAGDNPETLFVFVGPIDQVTRPWCLQHIGRVYSRAEIDQMDNKQIGPVFLTAGGYACRHSWVEISQASELVSLHGTLRRVPEVQADLDALKRDA